MYKKKFVSISFFPSKIKLAELSNSKKKVSHIASIAIPPGLIEKNRVVDVQKLSALIKESWKKLQITEKVVGITIPEFSTFTKLLKLPHLPIKELDEAVRWQAQEYIPQGKEVVLDWKVVKEDDTGYEILVVAVSLENLSSFVDAIDHAGLFPLVVETPSLSLVRATKNKTDGCVIVYVEEEESIITLAQGEKIYASSVIPGNNINLVVTTCDQMMRHYSSLTINSIYISGIGDLKLLENALSGYKKKVELINLTFEGIEPSRIQEYLIPLSLELKDPKEPTDEFSINLLPPKWVKNYDDKRKKGQLWSLSLIATIIIWTCFFSVIIVYSMLIAQVSIHKRQDEELKKGELPIDVKAKITEINDISKKVVKVVEFSKSPQKVMNELNRIKGEEIQIIGYHLDIENGKINLNGKAANRSSLIKFKKALEDDPSFSGVQIPLSSLEEQTNIDFTLNATYALKK